MNSDASAQHILAALSEKERQVLAIFTRYGPTVPGGLLTAEMCARGLDNRPHKYQNLVPCYEQRKNDLVQGLRDKLLLIGNSYEEYYSGYYNRRYPRLMLHPSILKAVAPADPLPWHASTACDEAEGTGRRSSAEVALDLWR
ncbi:MAG: hypothetical protein ABSH28_16465, partial [Acidobacteriota bacterium]